MGNPLSARLIANEVLVADGRSSLLPLCHSDTDREGSFRCEGLPPGDYLVEVVLTESSQPHSSGCSSQVKVGPPTFSFYPGTTNADQASLVTLSPDETRDLRFDLQDTSAVSVRGDLEKPVQKGSVSVSAAYGEDALDVGLAVVNDQRNGTFCVPSVPRGEYWLSLSRTLSDGKSFTSRQELTVDAQPMPTVSVSVAEPVTVPITLQGADGAGTGNALRAQRLDGSEADVIVPIKAGKAEVLMRRGERYALSLLSERNQLIDSLSIDGKSVDPTNFTVPASGLVRVEGMINGFGFSVHGHVTATDGAEHVIVLEAESSGEIWTTPADAQGGFQFRNLAPGQYRLYAWRAPSTVAYRSPSVREQYRTRSTEVTLGAGLLLEDQVLEDTQP